MPLLTRICMQGLGATATAALPRPAGIQTVPHISAPEAVPKPISGSVATRPAGLAALRPPVLPNGSSAVSSTVQPQPTAQAISRPAPAPFTAHQPQHISAAAVRPPLNPAQLAGAGRATQPLSQPIIQQPAEAQPAAAAVDEDSFFDSPTLAPPASQQLSSAPASAQPADTDEDFFNSVPTGVHCPACTEVGVLRECGCCQALQDTLSCSAGPPSRPQAPSAALPTQPRHAQFGGGPGAAAVLPAPQLEALKTANGLQSKGSGSSVSPFAAASLAPMPSRCALLPVCSTSWGRLC